MRSTAGKSKLNNDGSAIVTVLVVVAFITILATIMLYVSGMNFQMKVADYRTKESFYQAETPVEELRAQLVKDVEVAFAKAYTAAVSEYSGMGDEGTREASYRQYFCDELNKIWAERCGEIPDSNPKLLDWENGIRSVISSTEAGSYLDISVSPSSGLDTSEGGNGRVILKGVVFTYDSPDYYTSIISTDYCITIPRVNWSGTYESGAVPPAEEGESNPAATPEPSYFDGHFAGCVNYMNWTKQ